MKTLQLSQFSSVGQESRPSGISQVAIQGYKSISNECSIDLGYLTVLAGANSSGKSSFFQPLLILKQTLESPFNPGRLLINGDSVKLTSLEQVLSRTSSQPKNQDLIIQVELSSGKSVRLKFSEQRKRQGLKIVESCYSIIPENKTFLLKKELSRENLLYLMKEISENIYISGFIEIFEKYSGSPIIEESCFLDLGLFASNLSISVGLFADYANEIRRIIHVPGIRGNPERTYQRTAIGPEFSGVFDSYVASIVLSWKTEDKAKFRQISQDLFDLGLTWKIDANRVNDAQIELLIGRCSTNQHKRSSDTVNIVDVGFGVSQVLPVLVALLVAESNQLVYIEQPEIHLHPKAQVALAALLVRAAQRQVRVVVETHSSVLLLAIQSLVAEGHLDPSDTRLHWVTRNSEGITEINSTQLDEVGAFGDWPEDFADTLLKLQDRYLTAVEAKMFE